MLNSNRMREKLQKGLARYIFATRNERASPPFPSQVRDVDSAAWYVVV